MTFGIAEKTGQDLCRTECIVRVQTKNSPVSGGVFLLRKRESAPEGRISFFDHVIYGKRFEVIVARIPEEYYNQNQRLNRRT